MTRTLLAIIGAVVLFLVMLGAIVTLIVTRPAGPVVTPPVEQPRRVIVTPPQRDLVGRCGQFFVMKRLRGQEYKVTATVAWVVPPGSSAEMAYEGFSEGEVVPAGTASFWGSSCPQVAEEVEEEETPSSPAPSPRNGASPSPRNSNANGSASPKPSPAQQANKPAAKAQQASSDESSDTPSKAQTKSSEPPASQQAKPAGPACKGVRKGDSDGMTSVSAVGSVLSVEAWGGSLGDAVVVIPPGETATRSWEGGALWDYGCSNATPVLKDVASKGLPVYLVQGGELVKQSFR